MKKIVTLFLVSIALTINCYGQESSLKVEQYTLKNGLKVYLNEDHNQPNIFGAVVIKGGGKRDPKDATGIAHYFEHIMFKGTDKIGTINYKEEKVYLDSIVDLYEKLSKTKDEEERLAIQMKINEVSLKASDYAIPNEFDKIVTGMGGTALNAFTTEELIAYMNTFPSNQVEKWLELYSHRFINPVFRLFQSELETVYEEKNMYMDNFGSSLIENFNKNFYRNHPYGQQTVIGSTDHLKNPSLSKMQEYFDTYYVANNMALILCGDFNPEEVKVFIEEKFGRLRTGDIPSFPDYKEEPFNKREYVKERLTPIRVGLMGYRTIPSGHEDEVVLNVCNQLLANDASTGMLDKLYMDNELMSASMMLNNHTDIGGSIVLFVPKIIGQSMRKVENLIKDEVDNLAKGEFDDDLLAAIKINMKKQHEQQVESMKWRWYFIMNSFMEDKSWDEFMKYPEEIDKVTKEEIMKVAAKYYGDDYLVMYSKMGFPKKDKLDKPPYKAVAPKNSEGKSEYAQKMEDMKVKPTDVKFIEMGKDVRYKDIQDKVHFYYTPNPINNIFSLELSFGIGTLEKPILKQASNYFGLIGTESKSFMEYKKAMQQLGSSMYSSVSGNYFTITLDGLDENFEKTLLLLNELLTSMKADESQLDKLMQEAKMEVKWEIKDVNNQSDALKNYVLYKDRSSYINRLSVKEIKELSSDVLIDAIKDALKYEADIYYTGKISEKRITTLLLNKLQLPKERIKTESPLYREREKYNENTIYFVNDKKAVQSQINIMLEGGVDNEDSRTIAYAFNEYFGGGMSSLVFQEIREFRSFAYSAYAYYRTPFRNGKQGYLGGALSTQADKTHEALGVFVDLIKDMPVKEERMDMIKKGLTQTINADRPSFRGLASSVAYWNKQGYSQDPRKERIKVYNNMKFEDINNFYKKNLSGKSYVITIVGNEDRINMEELKKLGTIIKIEKDVIFTQ